MHFVFLPNKIELIVSIEFGDQTHQKVPVWSCSMTKPVEQQSNQLGSIEFDWFLVRFRSIDFAGSKCLNLIMGGGGGGIIKF